MLQSSEYQRNRSESEKQLSALASYELDAITLAPKFTVCVTEAI